MTEQHPEYDVIIAGTGIYGTSLGAILSRHGARVLLVERGSHPRFALGEALLPQSAIWPFVLAARFDVPELGHLSHADRIVDHITPTCGLKHSIGFAWHREDTPVASEHVHQPATAPALYSESHLYRQDVDAFLLDAARRHGCDYDETRIDAVSWTDEEAVVVSGGPWTAAVFVDATEAAANLPKTRATGTTPPAPAHSRCILAHVEGLPHRWVAHVDSYGRRLHDGTFHHMFEGGWMWVIPSTTSTARPPRSASVDA